MAAASSASDAAAAMANSPASTHTMMESAGDSTWAMTRPGVRRMPAPMEPPTTIATPNQTPRTRRSGIQAQSARAHERTRQAGGTAGALHADLGAAVFHDGRPGTFERSSGARVARQHHALPRREGQHVGPHRLELLVRSVDEADAASRELFVEGHREEARVYDGQVAIDRADERHQVHHVAGPLPVGERHL